MVFVEEVATFGNGNSFLKIKTKSSATGANKPKSEEVKAETLKSGEQNPSDKFTEKPNAVENTVNTMPFTMNFPRMHFDSKYRHEHFSIPTLIEFSASFKNSET